MKKEIVYTMEYETKEQIREANALRQALYEQYNSVQVYPNGLYEIKIVAVDPITKPCSNCGEATPIVWTGKTSDTNEMFYLCDECEMELTN